MLQVDYMFKVGDKNMDGYIDYHDFQLLMNTHFKVVPSVPNPKP